jgi:TrmH family RNA methyltransferase
MAVTAGFHSPHVRAARLLHSKKHRASARCFLIEGPALVSAALDAGAMPTALFYLPERSAAADASAAAAEAAGVPVYSVDERTLVSLAQTRAPQAIVAQVPFIERKGPEDLAALVPADGPATILVLHDLDDPGNAGTLVRTAEAFGVRAVCFGPESVEPYNDKLVRATMGALFRVPIVRYEAWPELAKSLERIGMQAVGAAAGAPDIRSVQPPARSALILGNERQGLSTLPADAVALTVGIPQRPQGDSLNVAVAGSILLYELARRGSQLGAQQ